MTSPEIEDYKTALDKVTASAEETALAATKVAVQIESMCKEIARLERAWEDLIKTCAKIDDTVHKAQTCPHNDKLSEFTRILLGVGDTPGIIGDIVRIKDSQRVQDTQISRIKGMLAVAGALILCLLPTVIVLFTKL